MSVFKVTLRTLSPLHIGDGNELRQGFDFTVHQGRTYRLDEDAVLTAKQAQLVRGRDGRYPTPGELLSEADYSNPAFFRYVLRGFPRSTQTDARIKSFIKDVHDRPYIPGSSLKGALRTALAWSGWGEVGLRLERGSVGRHRSWAGQPLERRLFGPDPNHDLLRLLQVADLFGPDKPGGGLLLVNAQVLTKKSAGSPIELEAVAGDQVFTGSLTIDETLFAPLAEKELHFANRKHWLDQLLPRVQAHSKARITELARWFEQAEGGQDIARFYRQLASADLGSGRALVQFGWGAGWDGKTFWSHLQADPQLFEQLVRDFRLHKAGRNSPPRRPGDPFPRAKRAAMTVKQGVAHPAAPFGWALLELSQE